MGSTSDEGGRKQIVDGQIQRRGGNLQKYLGKRRRWGLESRVVHQGLTESRKGAQNKSGR